MANSSGGDSKNTLYCSFCGKSQHEVRKLIAGPTVFICDECVELCMDIMEGEWSESHKYHIRPDEVAAGEVVELDERTDGQPRVLGCVVQLAASDAKLRFRPGCILDAPDRNAVAGPGRGP